MKEIKDYLHLYLGCDAMIAEGKDLYTLTAIQSNSTLCVMRNKKDSRNGDWIHNKNIKPILRPLSSMTEEEMKECGNLDYDFSDEPELNQWDWREFDTLISANQFHYLLSRHFDLFGLIEAGLAIDKTTL
jgi:hypothetical protein